MYRMLFSLFFLSFLHTGCAEKAPLSGYLMMNDDGWAPMVYLIQPTRLDEVATSFTGQLIDSAAVDSHGYFAFTKLPDSPSPMLLELAVQKKGERFLNRLNNEDLASANYMPIIWKNGAQLKISAEVGQFQHSFTMTSPSAENAALIKLRDIRKQAFQTHLQHENTAVHDEEQLLEKEAAHLNFQKALIDFAQQTSHLLPAMVAIRWVSPQNDYERIPEFLFSQCQKWQKVAPDHPWVITLCSKSSKEQLPVMKGDRLPDFSLPMLSGDTILISQLFGEQLTILDLWASWCAPCRLENRKVLVPLWEQYHNNGLQIIGYALDGSENAWKKSVEKDGAYRWQHASHLQGDDAPLLDTLRLRTIPANFILDKNGVVIAKNLHGEQLVQFVEDYLK
jgi:thiol-disulfide isomerase/thioredoxin